jgi:hypothetical protein
MKSLDGHELLVLHKEGMLDEQKRLVKKRLLLGETGLVWGSVIGPAGTSGGGFDVPVGVTAPRISSSQ